MSEVDMEPPSYFTTAPHGPTQQATPSHPVSTSTRRRPKSNSLNGEPRGDTGAAALSTLTDRTPPATPSLERSASDRAQPHSRRRKVRRLFRRWKTISLRHTWLNPLIVCVTTLLLYSLDPKPTNQLHKFIFLSYPQPGATPDAPVLYGKGLADLAFVAFYTVVLSFTREFIMQRVLRPAAVASGIKSRAKQARFMEQAYTAIYFAVFGPLGLWVMRQTPVWYFSTRGMYENFPHKAHEGFFKAYYLLQASYWAQQMIVLLLMLEKPRKDFKELVAHHCITLMLIGLSYRFHFMYMGLAVYITHDVSDFFLATTKTLNYLNSVYSGPYFGFFVLVWTYLRHYINLRILYSVLTEFQTVGPFEVNWETGQYKCRLAQVIVFGLLASLQAINIFWFVLILRIAFRYIRTMGQEIADERSDDESETDTGKAVAAHRKGKANAKVEAAPQLALAAGDGMHPGSPTLLLNGEPVEVGRDGGGRMTRSSNGGLHREGKKGR